MTQAEIPATIPALRPADTQAVPVTLVTTAAWAETEAGLEPAERSFAQAVGFKPKAGSLALLPGRDGGLGRVLFGLGDPEAASYDRLIVGKLPGLLPEGTFRLENAPEPAEAALAWLMGSYRFGRYRSGGATKARLAAPAGIDAADVERIAAAVAMGRDLVNTPANDLGPAEIEAAARTLAERHGATVSVMQGDALATDFPLIHAVGAASPRAPRLIDLTWGPTDAPRVTLVGKGVAFDTGGLDIKPSAAMLLMKKDMGGAAAALAAADMVMGAGLRLRLRVLIPAVENAVSGNAFRPGDVLPSRAGLSVEIGNTDAEGRLILADALTLADADAPGADPRLLDAHGRGPGGARAGPAGLLHGGRGAGRGRGGGRAGGDRPGLADAAARALREPARLQGGRPQQRLGRPVRGGDHRGAVPAPFRPEDEGARPFRPLWLEPLHQARPAGGRRGPDRAADLRAAQGALRGLIASRLCERSEAIQSAPR